MIKKNVVSSDGAVEEEAKTSSAHMLEKYSGVLSFDCAV